jgi:ankyrin repeat protein
MRLNRRGTAVGLAVIAVASVAVIEMRRTDRDSSLLTALENKDLAAAAVQLRNGANPNVRVPQYWPSHQLSDRVSFLQYKLMNPKQYYDYPILLAEVLRRDETSVKVLLSHGADPNTKMPDGITALKIARNSGATGIVELLQQSGAK